MHEFSEGLGVVGRSGRNHHSIRRWWPVEYDDLLVRTYAEVFSRHSTMGEPVIVQGLEGRSDLADDFCRTRLAQVTVDRQFVSDCSGRKLLGDDGEPTINGAGVKDMKQTNVLESCQ